MAVVKANCYGQGDYLCTFIEDIVDCFAVSSALEGAKLREIGITKGILVLGYNSSQYEIANRYNLMASLSSIHDYDEDMKYHIAVDTGMNRLGFKTVDELRQCLIGIKSDNIHGLYSHIFDNCSDNISKQMSKFNEFIRVSDEYIPNIPIHISSSNSMDSEYVSGTDITRLGIGLYDSAVSVVSDIMLVKHVLKGDSIGYDGEYVASEDMDIAVVTGGYADGILRQFTGNNVIINGVFCPIIGKISMDSFQCDISNCSACVGDNVIIIDNENITVGSVARNAKISEYEIYTGLKGRYKYVYYN